MQGTFSTTQPLLCKPRSQLLIQKAAAVMLQLRRPRLYDISKDVQFCFHYAGTTENVLKERGWASIYGQPFGKPSALSRSPANSRRHADCWVHSGHVQLIQAAQPYLELPLPATCPQGERLHTPTHSLCIIPWEVRSFGHRFAELQAMQSSRRECKEIAWLAAHWIWKSDINHVRHVSLNADVYKTSTLHYSQKLDNCLYTLFRTHKAVEDSSLPSLLAQRWEVSKPGTRESNLHPIQGHSSQSHSPKN